MVKIVSYTLKCLSTVKLYLIHITFKCLKKLINYTPMVKSNKKAYLKNIDKSIKQV